MIAEIFLSLFIVMLARYVITTYTTRRNMPPGPFPYPFIGNIPHMLCDPVNPFDKLAERYGDIFTVALPSGNAVVLNTASLVREARLERQNDFIGRLPDFTYPWGDILGDDLLTADYSPTYVFRRRVFKSAMHVFGAGIEQASQRARHAVDIVIEEIESKQGQPFSPKRLLESSILMQLWEWLTSKQISIDDPTIKDLCEFEAILSKIALLSNMYQLLPILSYLPTQFNRDIKRAQQIKNEIFPPEFRAHMETYTAGVVRDLTDTFISCYEQEFAKETSRDIGSIQDIPGLMLDVVLAGSDTTSTSLTWLLLYMLLYSDVQEKIHEEIDLVVGRDRLPSWKDVQNLPYLQATLCEVQRASGLAVVVAANTTCNTTVAGYHIPKGTFVAFNLSKLHHDEQEWPEPEKFDPARFLDSDGKFVGWSKLHSFLPFSVGRRECPGQSLAKIMMFTFASILLHQYNIELPEGEEMPTTEVSTPALVKRPNDFKVVAQKRNNFQN